MDALRGTHTLMPYSIASMSAGWLGYLVGWLVGWMDGWMDGASKMGGTTKASKSGLVCCTS